jgi:hypothetical protein
MPGVRPAEFGEPGSDHKGADVFGVRHANFSGRAQVVAERFALDRQDGFLDLFGLQPDGFAAFGQRIAGLGAVEEPGAQALFQRGNAAADRRGAGLESASYVFQISIANLELQGPMRPPRWG